MPCGCTRRRIAFAGAIRSTLRGAPGAIAPAARMIVRTTVEDVEAMARRIVTGRAGVGSGIPKGRDHPNP
ncbi:hypothetical protein SAMN05192568_10751 [Methylobacterium pseudosasicola]|uniref:Uncharacterized protein n=1 Tax=Methylobacterium pseudosasicola TaxID=582667 RepID=A0A1I4UQM7_9HYPH|nr:hypothetical protein SAMN05192568_10751 [Methylobacterium pseudosasicola]